MKMKDKLEKNHHKAGYYRIKRFCIGSVFAISLAAALVIPTYITSHQAAANQTKAVEVEVENEELENEEINTKKLLIY